jgi:protein-S-isoprenylcysteine O-methyltransferase Ste14
VKGFPDIPPVWLAGLMMAGWGLTRWVPLADVSNPLARIMGAALCAGGVALIGWAALWFYRKHTPIEPHHIPATLIVEGPYRISRNPIYLGMVAILAGVVLWWGALTAAPLPIILVWILQKRFVEPEEMILFETFGDPALDYISATRRWI